MPKLIRNFALIWILALLSAAPTWAGDRMAVEFQKNQTGSEKGLEYHYTFKVRNHMTGEAVSGAKFMIATDMPAMTGAHHMPHVAGKPTGNPGEYRATIDFDMAGKWSLILRFTSPHRDQIVVSDHIANYACKTPPCTAAGDHAGHHPKKHDAMHKKMN